MSVLSIKINIYHLTALQIVMAGSVGKSYQGDIALDDISMSSGPCKVASSMYYKFDNHVIDIRMLLLHQL